MRIVGPNHDKNIETCLHPLNRTPLIIIDEVSHITFDPEASNLFFQLVASHHRRASVIVACFKPLTTWAEIFSDAAIAPAMINRLVHHAEFPSLDGGLYRMEKGTP